MVWSYLICGFHGFSFVFQVLLCFAINFMCGALKLTKFCYFSAPYDDDEDNGTIWVVGPLSALLLSLANYSKFVIKLLDLITVPRQLFLKNTPNYKF